MADKSQLEILHQGVAAWNKWRAAHPEVARPDLEGANLARANLEGANLHWAYLRFANLNGAKLCKADLRRSDLLYATLRGEATNLSNARLRQANLRLARLDGACLFRANLLRANLSKAHLQKADLRQAELRQANLSEARLDGAKLQGTKLTSAILVETNLERANLTGSNIYGIAAWNPKLEGATQSDLVITRENEPTITVDDLEVAQFVYLLLKNEKIRNVIETMTSKAVLILGNFAPERKEILEEIRERLRSRDYLPILFDFEGPQNQRFIDTVTTVARLSRFVIADLTQPRSVTQELTAITDNLPLLPIKPLILRPEEPPHAFIRDVVGSDSVLKLHRYTSSQDLLASFDEEIIAPADQKRDELEMKRLRAIEEKLGDNHG